MTKQSVMTSCPDTSITTTSSASLDAAARAATVAMLDRLVGRGHRFGLLAGQRVGLRRDRAWSTYWTTPSGTRYQIGPVLLGALAAVGRRDRQRGHLHEAERVGGQFLHGRLDVLAVEFVTGSADADELGDGEHFLPVLPGQDRRQRVGAGDEVQVGVGVERAQVAQGVLGVGGPAAVDVDPADREPRVGARWRSPSSGSGPRRR